jgi:hypothetical protein
MTSELTFSNINHTLLKSASEIRHTERAEGKLNARSVINRFVDGGSGLLIDVLVLKKSITFIPGDSITFNECDIRSSTRRTFSKPSTSLKNRGRLPVKVGFFKKIEEGDTIIIILHGD